MEKNLKKNIYNMYNWIILLYMWNEHDTVNQLYFSKNTFFKKRAEVIVNKSSGYILLPF